MKALLLVGILLVAGLSLALAVPRDEIAGFLDLTADRLPAPPEIRIASPQEGEGVGARVVLAGEALSAQREVIDVQVRVDAASWQSIPDVPRGLASAPFSLTLEIAPGDHTLEARAWDGEAYSMLARVHVRRDAPTVRILQPAEGAALATGSTLVSGLVAGDADAVLVDAGGAPVEATLLAGGTWSASVPLSPGHRTIRATALAPVASLPANTRVAVGDPLPPTVTIGSPREGAAYGETGDLACGGGCILFAGASERASRIHVRIDGVDAGNATPLTGGAWNFRLPVQRLASGTHLATVTPYDAAEQAGAPREVAIAARTPLALEIRGDADARDTGTPLRFEASGSGVANAAWTLDGAPLASGPSASLVLGTPGAHELAVHVVLPDGRSATARLALFAYNRPPSIALEEPTLVGAALHFRVFGSDSDGAIRTYAWEFGDGTRQNTTTPTIGHRYTERGLYVANVTVVDDLGATARSSTLALVPNVPPLVDFTFAPETPSILDVVTFTDTSVDLDGGSLSRAWSFDDGSSSTNATPSVRFRTRGPHNVTLTVADEVGDIVSLTRTIDVVDLAPEPFFSWTPAVPRVHEEVIFLDNTTDVDGPLAARSWDFGDGGAGNGSAALHIFRSPGLHNVTLHVLDDMGLGANITLPLIVADHEPTVTAVVVDPPQPVSHDAVRFRVLAADREGSVVALVWDFGDGSTGNDTEPVHRYARSGHYAGLVTVYDEAGLFTRFPFRVDVANAPPEGTLAIVDGGFAAFPTILAVNASDPDGRLNLYRIDADGDGLIDCETTEPVCRFTYAMPGVYAVLAWIEDDEAAMSAIGLVVDIRAPPSHLAPPRVTIESPFADAHLRGDHLVRGSASGVRPIETVELQFRNDTWAFSGTRNAWRLANAGASWSALVDTRAFADGAYELVVRATDTGGGVGYARVPVHVQNGARASEVTLQLLAPPDTLHEYAALRGSAFHPQGVTSVRWRIDDALWHYVAESPLAFTIPLDPRDMTPGEHTLLVEAYRGPSEKATQTHPFRVPGAAPVLIIDEPPGRLAHALLAASGRVVGEGRVEWRLDHEVWTPLSAGETWTLRESTLDIPGGRHTLDLRAVSPDARLASPIHTYTVEIINPPFDTEPARPSSPPPLVPLGVPNPLWLALLAGGLAALALRRRAK